MIKINNALIHYRFKSFDSNHPNKYPFNINSNTLKANYELWICGDKKCYYLVPIKVIKNIYDDPETYTNKTEGQETIKTLSIDISTNMCQFGRNSKKISVRQYLNLILDTL